MSTTSNGNWAGEQILAGQIDLETIREWLDWPDRARGSRVLESIATWLLREMESETHVAAAEDRLTDLSTQ